jgi:hypothetical protein
MVVPTATIPAGGLAAHFLHFGASAQHGWNDSQIRAYKQKMIETKIVISGHERLAKLIPTTGHSPGEEYPPWKGIFQLKIVRALTFRVKASIATGQKWLGDYSS